MSGICGRAVRGALSLGSGSERCARGPARPAAECEIRATQNLPNFTDGSAQAIEYGAPVDDGDYELRSYYILPAIPDTIEIYWRMEVTP